MINILQQNDIFSKCGAISLFIIIPYSKQKDLPASFLSFMLIYFKNFVSNATSFVECEINCKDERYPRT
jgi:hypothetical protein